MTQNKKGLTDVFPATSLKQQHTLHLSLLECKVGIYKHSLKASSSGRKAQCFQIEVSHNDWAGGEWWSPVNDEDDTRLMRICPLWSSLSDTTRHFSEIYSRSWHIVTFQREMLHFELIKLFLFSTEAAAQPTPLKYLIYSSQWKPFTSPLKDILRHLFGSDWRVSSSSKPLIMEIWRCHHSDWSV